MTLSDHTGELDHVVYRCPIDQPVNEWVAANVLPAINDIEINSSDYDGLLYNLRDRYTTWCEEGTPLIAHVAWPVEARLLLDMLPGEDVWLGPYPLVDVASVLLARGHNPLSVDDYLTTHAIPAPPGSPHHPLYDARAAERCLRHLLTPNRVRNPVSTEQTLRTINATLAATEALMTDDAAAPGTDQHISLTEQRMTPEARAAMYPAADRVPAHRVDPAGLPTAERLRRQRDDLAAELNQVRDVLTRADIQTTDTTSTPDLVEQLVRQRNDAQLVAAARQAATGGLEAQLAGLRADLTQAQQLAAPLERAESVRIDRDDDIWRSVEGDLWKTRGYNPLPLDDVEHLCGPTKAVLFVGIEQDEPAAPILGSAEPHAQGEAGPRKLTPAEERQRHLEERVDRLEDRVDELRLEPEWDPTEAEPGPAAVWHPGAEQLAQAFHETYEELAPRFGYATREASAKPWEHVPENNRRLMTATCRALLRRIFGPAQHVDGPAEIPGHDGIEVLLANVARSLTSAVDDAERAEAVEMLLGGWYAAWPASAVTDPHAPLAGELVRLLGRGEPVGMRPADWQQRAVDAARDALAETWAFLGASAIAEVAVSAVIDAGLAGAGGCCPTCGTTYPRTLPAGEDQRCWTCSTKEVTRLPKHPDQLPANTRDDLIDRLAAALARLMEHTGLDGITEATWEGWQALLDEHGKRTREG